MAKVLFIVSGGQLGDPAFLEAKIEALRPAALIAADRGARHLLAVGIMPTLIVGDLDSLAEEDLARCRDAGCRILRHPPGKDETDTELALREAFALGPSLIMIWGALGYRIDHSLANIFLLWQGLDRGIDIRLIDEWVEVFLVRGKGKVCGDEGHTVSLFPWGGKAEGVSLKGFEYPLTGAAMGVDHPYGVSNRLMEKVGTIEVEKGCLLVIHHLKRDVFPGGGS